MDNIIEKWHEFVRNMNAKGIPMPLLRDSRTQKGSATLTMFWIAFNLCVIGLIGKWSKQLDGIDVGNALQLLMITGGFYLGRSVIKGKDTRMDAETKPEQKPEDPQP